MKFMKWKILIVTCLICLLPILLGLALWDILPDTIAIHFNIHNEPDRYASKRFAVFCLPALMALLQIVCCVINDANAYKHGTRKKFELATKWIIPVMSVLLQVITLGYSLGWIIDIGKAVAIIVGAVFIVIGNYLPKLDYIKNYNIDAEKARKINRFVGYESVVMGLLFIISIFLPPIFTIICLWLLIPYALISVIYGIIIGTKPAK